MTGPALAATSFKDLTIRQNNVTASATSKMFGAIRAELGSALSLESNGWITPRGSAFPCLYYDADTTSKIVSRGNVPLGTGVPR